MNLFDSINLLNSKFFKDRTIFFGGVRLDLSIINGVCDTPEATKHQGIHKKFEPQHDKTNKMTCAPGENSDPPGYPSSLIRVFDVRSVGS